MQSLREPPVLNHHLKQLLRGFEACYRQVPSFYLPSSIQSGGSGTKHVAGRLTPGVLGQNMLGLVSPSPSPPRTEWELWDKNTREFLCKNDKTPLAGRIGLPNSLLTLLPAGPTPPPRWAPMLFSPAVNEDLFLKLSPLAPYHLKMPE